MAINTFLSGSTWNTPANWSQGYVPIYGETVVFTASSATCSLDIDTTISSIDFSNYYNRFNFKTFSMMINGDATFNNRMSFSYSASATYSGFNLLIGSSSTIKTNGFTVSVPLCFYVCDSNNIYTLSDNLVVSQKFGTGASVSNATHTINGGTIDLYSNFNPHGIGVTSPTSYITGNSTINIYGTCSITTGMTFSAATGSGISLDVNIQPTSRIITTNTSGLYFNSCTVSVIGTPVFTGNTFYSLIPCTRFNFIAASSSSSYIIPIRLQSTSTQTSPTVDLGSDVHIYSVSSNGITLNNYKTYCYTSYSNVTRTSGGSSVLVITGTNSAATTTISTSTKLTNSIIIDSIGIISMDILYGGSVIKQLNGRLTSSSTLTTSMSTGTLSLYITSSFSRITFGNSGTYSIDYPLNVDNINISGGTDIRFDGDYSWKTKNFNYYNTLVIKTASYGLYPLYDRSGCVLKPGLTYTISSSMICIPSVNFSDQIFTFKTSTPGSRASLIFNGGYSQSNVSITTNDIDSSAGDTIIVYNLDSYTASVNTLNWVTLNDQTMQEISLFAS